MGEQSVPESQSSAEHKAIGELLERAIRMGECAGASPEIKRLVARGVLNSATRVAVLLGWTWTRRRSLSRCNRPR